MRREREDIPFNLGLTYVHASDGSIESPVRVFTYIETRRQDRGKKVVNTRKYEIPPSTKEKGCNIE